MVADCGAALTPLARSSFDSAGAERRLCALFGVESLEGFGSFGRAELSAMGALVDYPMNYHVTGSIRLGHSKERLQEFKRVVGMGRYQGMALEVYFDEEAARAYARDEGRRFR